MDECCLVVGLLADTLTGPVVTQKLVAFTIKPLFFSLFHHISRSPSSSPLFLLSLHNSCPIFTTVQSRLSLSALDNSDHLCTLGCGGNSHFSGMAETIPPPPTTTSRILSPSLLSFSHFLLKPFFSLPPSPPLPTPSLPRESLNLLNLGVRMFHRVTQINVPSPPAQRQSSSVAPSLSTDW